MRWTAPLAICLAAIAVVGCQRAPHAGATSGAGHAAYAPQDWRLPTSPGAAQPGLLATADGRILLSWIDSAVGRRNALQFAIWDGSGQWQSNPRTIVVGDSLVTDAANAPQLGATADGALWVEWLQKNGDANQALQISRSADGGFNWSAPVQVSLAATGTDLGFASLWPASPTGIGLAWLDGGAASAETDAAARPAHATAATRLRAALFDASLRRTDGADVDAMVCDCCRTAVSVATRGAVLAYRDRTPAEIRDIATTRFDGRQWTQPRPVHADRWVMPGCPVNGPSIAAQGNEVVVAWYTAAGGQPTVLLARSRDGGDTFAAPVVLDQGSAVLGRVAVARDASQAWVAWLREDATGQSVWLARYTPDLSKPLQRVRLATLHGRGRVTGFPQLAVQGGSAYVVWTDAEDRATQLHGAILAR